VLKGLAIMNKKVKFEASWKWCKWTFGVWREVNDHTAYGVSVGPLEIIVRIAHEQKR
jgi:hypothetical protein